MKLCRVACVIMTKSTCDVRIVVLTHVISYISLHVQGKKQHRMHLHECIHGFVVGSHADSISPYSDSQASSL